MSMTEMVEGVTPLLGAAGKMVAATGLIQTFVPGTTKAKASEVAEKSLTTFASGSSGEKSVSWKKVIVQALVTTAAIIGIGIALFCSVHWIAAIAIITAISFIAFMIIFARLQRGQILLAKAEEENSQMAASVARDEGLLKQARNELESVHKTVEGQKEQIQEQEKNLEEQGKALETAQQNLEIERETHAALQHAQEGQIEQQAEQIKQLEQTNTQLVGLVSGLYTDQAQFVASLQTRIQDLEALNTQLIANAQSIAEGEQELNDVITWASGEIQKIQKDVQEIQQLLTIEGEGAQAATMLERMQRANVIIQRVLGNVMSLDTELSKKLLAVQGTLREKRLALEEGIKEQEAALAAAKQEVESNRKNITQKEQELAKLKQTLLESQTKSAEERAKLGKEIEEKKAEVHRATEGQRDAKQDLLKAQKLLEKEQQTCKKLRESNETLSSQVTAAQNTHKKLEEGLEEKKALVAEHAATITELQSHMSGFGGIGTAIVAGALAAMGTYSPVVAPVVAAAGAGATVMLGGTRTIAGVTTAAKATFSAVKRGVQTVFPGRKKESPTPSDKAKAPAPTSPGTSSKGRRRKRKKKQE